jgi:hypothetical protein
MKPSKNKDRRSQGTFEHNNSNLMIKKIREKSQNWLVINYFCRIEINMIVKYNSLIYFSFSSRKVRKLFIFNQPLNIVNKINKFKNNLLWEIIY